MSGNSIAIPINGPSPGRVFRLTGLGLMMAGTAILVQVVSTSPSMASGGGNNLAPLSSVAIPQAGGSEIINTAAGRLAAVQLGKALFWDVQAGGDGKQACASCHFRAGEDTRLFDTLNPGNDGKFSSLGVTGPGQTIKVRPADDLGTIHPAANITNDDRLGSAGVSRANFNSVTASPADNCTAIDDPVFHGFRRVTGRKAPSVINAVYNHDNFWDGRANHDFNGVNPFGSTGNNLALSLVSLTNSSPASQAVGPANNEVEMSCAGREFNGTNSLAAKMLGKTPLALQHVSNSDSVLGALANSDKGLNVSYGKLIERAFGVSDPLKQRDRFSSYWGQAVQAYEGTLISDRTPMDRYLSGDQSALTASQAKGLDIFQGKGNCTKCHAGAEMSDATVGFYAREGSINRDGGDQGFHNLGVRPTGEDAGRAGTGPNGVSWSVSGSTSDNGAFKTPGLRNVGLLRSYFHTGGKATLGDVVDFYARGGDFANAEKAHDLQPISLSSSDKSALVDFLKHGLTDCRVKNEAAPFDHPELPLNGADTRAATGAGGFGPCS